MATAVRRQRGEYAKTRGRRQEIIETAVSVFSSAGFYQGSLRVIADGVGLSQAGLQHHFPAKELLLQAVLSWRDDEAAARLGDPLPEGIDLLRGIVAFIDYNASTPGLVELHVRLSAEGTSAEHPLHNYFIARYARLYALARGALERAEMLGELKPGVDPACAARTVIALMDGLQVQWLLHRDEVDMAGDLRRHLQSLLTVDL